MHLWLEKDVKVLMGVCFLSKILSTMILCVPLGKLIIGWYHFKKWLKNQKWPNHFLKPFPLNVFIAIMFFSQIYSLHALTYALKFILEQKKNFKKVLLLIVMAPS
jgi:hypothetical protein